MSTKHLDENEMVLALAGEALPPDREEHRRECPRCRAEAGEFEAVAVAAAGPDPGDAARAHVRGAALDRWEQGRASSPRAWRWWAAAAAVVLLALVPLLAGRGPSRIAAVDPDTVLRQVDAELSKDPLSAVASEDVVNVLVSVKDPGSERSVS